MGDEAALDGGGLDRFLQFLEGADFDLAHPLARDAVLLRQVFPCGRVGDAQGLGVPEPVPDGVLLPLLPVAGP